MPAERVSMRRVREILRLKHECGATDRAIARSLGIARSTVAVTLDRLAAAELRHRLAGLLRQSVFGRLAGYEDVNDAERLCRDPAMRWVVGDRAITGFAASASQMGRFETKWLCRAENLVALANLPGQWIDKVQQRRPPKMIVLDMDSSESPTYGTQEGSAYNGHFGCTAAREADRDEARDRDQCAGQHRKRGGDIGMSCSLDSVD